MLKHILYDDATEGLFFCPKCNTERLGSCQESTSVVGGIEVKCHTCNTVYSKSKLEDIELSYSQKTTAESFMYNPTKIDENGKDSDFEPIKKR